MRRSKQQTMILHGFLLLGSIFMVYPFIFGLLASLSTLESYYQNIWLPIPADPDLSNYQAIFSYDQKIILWVINTLIRILWYILVPGVIAVLCGYVFTRLQFVGRELIFTILLASMMMPAIVYTIPTYIMLARWPLVGGNDGWGQGGHGFVNEWPALLIPTLVNAYFIFLMRQTFYSIPSDFEDAARIDGANTFQVLRHVYLPLLKPAITVMVIFQSVAVWNDYLWPLIVVGGNEDNWPLALGFQRIMFIGSRVKGLPAGTIVVDYPFAFALATVAVIPTILLFLMLQRYFVEGVQGFAIKG